MQTSARRSIMYGGMVNVPPFQSNTWQNKLINNVVPFSGLTFPTTLPEQHPAEQGTPIFSADGCKG